jgi:hypothetical protein
MAHVVGEDVRPDPVVVGLLGAAVAMPRPQGFAKPVEQLRLASVVLDRRAHPACPILQRVPLMLSSPRRFPWGRAYVASSLTHYTSTSADVKSFLRTANSPAKSFARAGESSPRPAFLSHDQPAAPMAAHCERRGRAALLDIPIRERYNADRTAKGIPLCSGGIAEEGPAED